VSFFINAKLTVVGYAEVVGDKCSQRSYFSAASLSPGRPSAEVPESDLPVKLSDSCA
jgi:hypothetical protein